MSEHVPYVDLVSQNTALEDEIMEAVREVVRSGWFINGPPVARFEAELAAFLGAEHVVGVNSGTDALILALRAYGIGPGDEVITTSHTYYATISAIALCGATPVLVDVDPETMTIDPEAARAAIGPKTRALIAVHLNGFPCDMDALTELCSSHGVLLLEDAAQAMGATWRGKRVGTFGEVGCFSLHPLKVLSAVGDAGVVVAQDADIAQKMREMRTVGHVDRDHVRWVSHNCRLDTLHAAILSVKLKHIDAYIDARRAHGAAYENAFAGKVDLPRRAPHAAGVYCPFVFQHPRRDALLEALLESGVDAKIHYRIPSHAQEAFETYGPFDLPQTELVVGRIVSLPSSQDLTVAQRELVIARTLKCLERVGG